MSSRESSIEPIISIKGLQKTYAGGFQALKNIDLEILDGEIIALLGPNGAGKTTLISSVCGIVNPSGGTITVAGYDTVKQFRQARNLIGLVPQELTTDAFESVWNTVNFSRGLFGKPANPAFVEKILRDLSLWEKKDNMLMELSGGMKRRVMIAKALSHEPQILFLDEPTAGVDVELRKDMWKVVRNLRDSGVTVILTTHYIEEAEEIADRIGVIQKGQILIVEDKHKLMRQLGKRQIVLTIRESINEIPASLAEYELGIGNNASEIIYTYHASENYSDASQTLNITELLDALKTAGLTLVDIQTEQSSLEDIFVELIKEK